jgi:hypothetical protein
MMLKYCNYSYATNNGDKPFLTGQTSCGFVALFENIYDGGLIFTFSVSGEDVQHHNVSVKGAQV